ncbi:MAG: hypothetical protein M1832_004463 [Thelocarpon impressellum]|nr:MAG: hypothetical protein M1832_004463 [Thelocarpon impressellum]
MSSLRKNLTEASDMDDMISVHAAFIARLEHQCLLSERLSSVLQAVISLLDLSILFSDAYVLYIGERAFDTSNRSIFLDGTSAQASKHARRRQASNSSSSDEDTSTMNGGAHTSPPATPYIDRLAKMSSQFEHLCRLVEVSLRGLARAGGESPFEMLAERLEWGLNPERRWRRVG